MQFRAMRALLETLESGDWEKAHERYLEFGLQIAETGGRSFWGTSRPLLMAGAVMAQGDDSEPFGRFCREILARFEIEEDPEIAAHAAMAALARPLHGSGILTKQACALMARAYPERDPIAWSYFAMALAEYRLGQFDPAHYQEVRPLLEKALDPAVDPNFEPFAAGANLLHALVSCRLGETEEAARFVAQAEPMVQRLMEELPDAIRNESGTWHISLMWKTFLEEARGLLGEAQAPPDAP